MVVCRLRAVPMGVSPGDRGKSRSPVPICRPFERGEVRIRLPTGLSLPAYGSARRHPTGQRSLPILDPVHLLLHFPFLCRQPRLGKSLHPDFRRFVRFLRLGFEPSLGQQFRYRPVLGFSARSYRSYPPYEPPKLEVGRSPGRAERRDLIFLSRNGFFYSRRFLPGPAGPDWLEKGSSEVMGPFVFPHRGGNLSAHSSFRKNPRLVYRKSIAVYGSCPGTPTRRRLFSRTSGFQIPTRRLLGAGRG